MDGFGAFEIDEYKSKTKRCLFVFGLCKLGILYFPKPCDAFLIKKHLVIPQGN